MNQPCSCGESKAVDLRNRYGTSNIVGMATRKRLDAFPDDQLTLLPRLFSSTHLTRIACRGSSDLFPFVQDSLEAMGASRSLASLFDTAFEIIRRRYPVEYVYKTCLLKRLLFGKYSPRTTASYLEFPVADARADMVLVNGDATVYEVKSRFDSPARLEAQLREYYKCFTRVVVVTEETEAESYLKRLPDHVGVATLTRRFSISTKREPSCFLDGLEHARIFMTLHQPERYRIGKELGIPVMEIDPRTRHWHLLEQFEAAVTMEDANRKLVDALRVRQPTKKFARRCDQLPESLHVAVFSYNLRKMDWDALFDAMPFPPLHKKGLIRVLPVPT